MLKKLRIRTEIGVDKEVTFDLNKDFDLLEILSLNLHQTDVYPKDCSEFGVVWDHSPEHDFSSDFSSFYDSGGSIGRRYRRQDEAGTPFGVTVDHDTLEDNTVTLRERDTMNQIRVSIDKLTDAVADKIKNI